MGIRCIKSTHDHPNTQSVNVRPIWHQRSDRIESHILVCFLAFVRSGCPASLNPMPLRPLCWIGSASHLPKRMRLAEDELPASAATAWFLEPNVVTTFRLTP